MHPYVWNGNVTVPEFGLESTQNSVCKPMEVLKCVNNALILNLKIPSKIQMKNQRIMW